jgi:CheY-like chemotaxis protein
VNILYADDDPDDLELFIEAVHEVDPSVQCMTAKDGIEALETLKNTGELPRLVFLDINMPKMDGLKCLQHIRKDPSIGPVKIIMYSTSLREGDKKILEANNAQFISKSTSLAHLKAVLDGLIKN